MDARKTKSRGAIVAAFSELLREEDYGKITVGDIIARPCGSGHVLRPL